jgi:hypothetical protein
MSSTSGGVVVLADGAAHVLVEVREVPVRVDLGHAVDRDEQGRGMKRCDLGRGGVNQVGDHAGESGVWVPESRCTLCDLLILIEQPAESVTASDVVALCLRTFAC